MVRAEYYLKRFQELGLKDASIDTEGNVIGLRKGSGGGRPKLVVSAHLDTIFSRGCRRIRERERRRHPGAGIGDDSRGLAALLSLIKSINANEIATVGDVMFVGTVGEEEPAISGASRRYSATTPTSTASSRSTGSALPGLSIRRPGAIATK